MLCCCCLRCHFQPNKNCNYNSFMYTHSVCIVREFFVVVVVVAPCYEDLFVLGPYTRSRCAFSDAFGLCVFSEL